MCLRGVFKIKQKATTARKEPAISKSMAVFLQMMISLPYQGIFQLTPRPIPIPMATAAAVTKASSIRAVPDR